MLHSKLYLVLTVSQRNFVTSLVKCRKDKDVDRIRKAVRDKKNASWKKIERANIFETNVGARHQVKVLGMDDPSDVSLVNMFEGDQFQLGGNESQIFQEAEDITQKSRTLYHGSKRKANNPSREIVRRILTKKNFFPEPRDPPLLTWIEKETIKNLHNMDQSEWTIERLSEGFPVTKRSLKLFIKSRYVMTAKEIKAHDDEVQKNWLLLSQGKLEITEELRDHLMEFSDSITKRARSFMTDESYIKLVNGVLENHKRLLMPIKRAKKGEFGSIISDYNKNLEALNPENKKKEPIVAIQENSSGLLNTSWKDTIPDLPSPTSGTAFMSFAHKRLWKEKEITLQKFKQEYIEKNQKKFTQKKGKLTPEAQSLGQTYYDWFNEEKAKDRLAETRSVKKMSSKEVDHELEELNRMRFFKLPPLKSLPSPEADYRYKEIKSQNLMDEDPLQSVKIPPDQYVQGAIYKMNNCIYDADGNFLYRFTNQ